MKKVLIANRGEIAHRILKTCHELGIETIAIYSDADKDLPYVKEATIAFRVGEPPVAKSYLQTEVILDIAVREGADAIHPGYGFLSENASFAKAVEEKGITFIGPKSDVLSLMGDKVAARATMVEAGVPVVPGTEKSTDTVEQACLLASEIGYPVMLKASGGGGGIGMQRCEDEASLVNAFQTTKGRAKAYFGNEKVFIEKFISDARHVEIQLFGDQYGNIVHLFERDCSIQRRNQKVIEESPSPLLTEKTRQKMCDAALLAAKSVNYVNAGTIEFIVDEKENFYFLEMNTRLQVEHRVTEMVTGLDLVKWQLLIASGEKLPLQQDEIDHLGHAIEFRIYAEDPVKFLPSPGKITAFSYPHFDGVIIDQAYTEGNSVTPFYDPLLAKVIVHDDNRTKAIEKAKNYLTQVEIEGVKTNLPLFINILGDSSFQEGYYTTSFLNGKKVNGAPSI
ncbi:acetyl/propionyl/methylcrotonyl-CoA carboxylase subunit alpha [Metabacillus herbersteinensis]|uniref:Acetyl/propionyl/methylcrotonyl-CoA carboxylase subunit alpha n=1 Tax=Metabacillus herbersteinensis TaxID=283816 RepID=A0ABV6GBY3_9BACI